MTQEEKAKRYDEALEELRGLLEGIREEKCKILEEDITSIFPELLENEDERIRKELIFYLGDMPEDTELRNGVTNRDVLVWLEKQSEQKSQGKSALEAINEEKADNANKIEQKPAWSEEYIADVFEKVGLAKIAREQSNDALTIALQDAMIELSKVTLQPKPTAWSEEDEIHIRELESLVKQVWATAEHENDKNTIHKMSDLSFFLKTLKPQLKQEWSEEDEKMWATISDLLWDGYEMSDGKVSWDNIRDWLLPKITSLRYQNTWKPSYEQMKELNYAVNAMASSRFARENDCCYNVLKTLRDQLEKLK